MTQKPRRGISKEILDMISKSIGKPPNTSRPSFPAPAAQDATRVAPHLLERVVPLRKFVDDVPREERVRRRF